MLDSTGNIIKRKRKPKKIYSPDQDNKVRAATNPIPIESTPPSSAAKMSTPSSSAITEQDVENLLNEIPDEGDGMRFKQFLAVTRKAIIKDFTEILNDKIAFLVTENKILKDTVAKLEKTVKDNQIQFEIDVNKLEQYGRRSNVEIAGIPDEVSLPSLESKVVEVLGEIGVKVTPDEIEACHRLQKNRNDRGPSRTIVRFVNRKKCDKIFANKRRLKDIDKKKIGIKNNIYINYSLCRDYRRLHYTARKLHNDGVINRFWVSNGTVKIAVTENSPPISILHKSKFEELFPGRDLDGPIVKTSR